MLLGRTHDVDSMTNVCLPQLLWDFLVFSKASKTLCNIWWCMAHPYSKGRSHRRGRGRGAEWRAVWSGVARFICSPCALQAQRWCTWGREYVSAGSGQQVLSFFLGIFFSASHYLLIVHPFLFDLWRCHDMLLSRDNISFWDYSTSTAAAVPGGKKKPWCIFVEGFFSFFISQSITFLIVPGRSPLMLSQT